MSDRQFNVLNVDSGEIVENVSQIYPLSAESARPSQLALPFRLADKSTELVPGTHVKIIIKKLSMERDVFITQLIAETYDSDLEVLEPENPNDIDLDSIDLQVHTNIF